MIGRLNCRGERWRYLVGNVHFATIRCYHTGIWAAAGWYVSNNIKVKSINNGNAPGQVNRRGYRHYAIAAYNGIKLAAIRADSQTCYTNLVYALVVIKIN